MARQNRIASAALLATLGICQFGMAQAAQWLVQPIVDPADSSTTTSIITLTGLNNSGVVVGYKDLTELNGFVTGPNGIGYQSLGKTFGGLVGVDDTAEVSSIGSTGLVFITPPGSLTLNNIALLPGATQNSINGISADGRIVGRNGRWITLKEMAWNQIFFTGPHGTGITEWIKPTQFYDVQPTGINSSGQIIGNAAVSVNQTAGYVTHAMLTGPNGAGYQDLGTLGGTVSKAIGVNDSGQVTGNSELVVGQTNQRAYLTGPNGAAMKDLGDLGGGKSTATGLNNLGQVVGSSYTTTTALETTAFITGPNGVGMRNLTKEVLLPGTATLRTALAIHDKGQVIAQDTNYKSYLLTPMPAGECAVTYKVTYTGLGLYTAQVSVNNQSAISQSGWSVSWQYSVRPVYLVNNAKITANGTAFTATPTTSTMTIKAKSTVTFTITGSTKAGKAPAVSDFIASLAGKSCTATVQ
jgi:probable HAF family extracellular repeat protein